MTGQGIAVAASGDEAEWLRWRRAVRATGGSPEPGRELMTLDVACTHHAPAVIRAALGDIRELGAVRVDVILVASELVTNAVMHSGGSAADAIQVRAVLIGPDVLVAVDDPGLAGDTPRMRGADVLRVGGNGLWIVNRLARHWGFERGRGCRVWAQLGLIAESDCWDARSCPGDRVGWGAGRLRGRLGASAG